MRLISTISAVVLSGLLATQAVAAAPIHNIVVFGDSLSDNGNLYEIMNHQFPPSPPYYPGRFSNGPVWIEFMAQKYFANPSQHLQDFAIGGAGVSEDPEDQELFTLSKEVDSYLQSNQGIASSDSLYIVWIGANNYLGIPPDADDAIEKVSDGIKHSLQLLVEKGAKNILLLNLPDLGRTPAGTEFNSVETYSYFSTEHNRRLNDNLVTMKQMYPQVNWLFIDMEQLFNDVLANPQKYGFTNTTEPCNKTITEFCSGYVFFDLVHPTVSAHQVVADTVKAALDQTGLEIGD